MTYVIKPLLLGKHTMSKGQMTYFMDYEKLIWSAITVWYIKAGDKHVLVDTGISPPVVQKYMYGKEYQEVQSLEQALGTVGITPQDVDIVIQTHLHFDHCGNTAKCTNAKVVIQEEELKFAYSPHALFAGSYNLEFLRDLHFSVVSGTAEILPGIRVHHFPGHSPGTQGVAVDTAKGVAIIAGFCSLKENLFPPEKMRTRWPIIAPGVTVNSLQAFDSAMKMKAMADIPIPMHDMEYAEMKQIP